ncbi:peroxidase mlt-7-like [Palaemon carinicauda]|uniref:peroxidase mlt-7-like n=1 Tax=Palaemon carinicauda TaxID=392227 RepID=UPI0035B5A0B2
MFVYVRDSLTKLGLLTLTALVTDTAAHLLGSCEDHSTECSKWESWGFCDTNLRFMAQNCPVSCNVCIDPDCFDRFPLCDSMATEEFCAKVLSPLLQLVSYP